MSEHKIGMTRAGTLVGLRDAIAEEASLLESKSNGFDMREGINEIRIMAEAFELLCGSPALEVDSET